MKATIVLLALVFCGACSLLTPSDKESLRTGIRAAVANGEMTEGQGERALAALDRDDAGLDLTTWLYTILVGGIPGAVGGTALVRKLRGPPATPEERVARKASKVRRA